jgi:hypothetical protein
MPLSIKDIRNIIKSLNTKNSHGYDEISTKSLKLSTPFILRPLNHICNKSLLLGIFPDRLKYSEIKPLFKKGDKQNISNYRPISILTLCRSYLNLYCLGRKTAFFPVDI